MLFKTRLFIGVCILVFLVAMFGGQDSKSTTPVQKAEKVESVVNEYDLNSLCAADPSELRVHTNFDRSLWCYQA